MKNCAKSSGFTLVEVMIVIAILAILASIAIPLYTDHMQEARMSSARANIEHLRVALEDHWLENDTYADLNGKVWHPTGAKTLQTDHNWRPDGDNNQFIYTVVAADALTWAIQIEYLQDPNNTWARCEKPGNRCCFPDQGAIKGNACP